MPTTATVDFGTCPTCGYRMLPVLALSPCGHDADPEVAPLNAPGTVYTWTRVWSGDDSTIMAMVDFLEGDLRVTAPVLDTDRIEIGDRVYATRGETTPYAFRTADLDG